MTSRRLRILQVSTLAQGGGAEHVARSLHEAFRARGHKSWMAVGERNVDDPDIFAIPARRPGAPARWLGRAAEAIAPLVGQTRGMARLHDALRDLAVSPEYYWSVRRGREFFGYPGTASIPLLPPEPAEVIHCHNLHGGYFDLRQLPAMSRTAPIAMTLHDEWSFTGHCAYTLDSDRWRTGCGSCPHLDTYPSIRRDGTHENWLAKRGIYERSRLYVSAPSEWLIDRARDSVLASAAVSWRVIPNGVDRTVFRPRDRADARRELGLPVDALLLLFTANAARRSKFKDYETVVTAAKRIAAARPDRSVLLLILGDEWPPEQMPNGEIRFVPYESDIRRVAAYFAAADLYLHAAKAENLPTTILQALATGLPVVATAVGGIPEAVRSLAGVPGAWAGQGYSTDAATGVLVPAGDGAGMAAAALQILGRDDLRKKLSANAQASAAERFGLDRQVDATIEWYEDIIADWRTHAAASSAGSPS